MLFNMDRMEFVLWQIPFWNGHILNYPPFSQINTFPSRLYPIPNSTTYLSTPAKIENNEIFYMSSLIRQYTPMPSFFKIFSGNFSSSFIFKGWHCDDNMLHWWHWSHMTWPGSIWQHCLPRLQMNAAELSPALLQQLLITDYRPLETEISYNSCIVSQPKLPIMHSVSENLQQAKQLE